MGINLLLQGAGQKPKPLTSFNRRARENNAVHPLRHESRDCHRHREIGFAGSRRAYAEDHVVFFDGFKIATLVNALRLNATPAEGTLLTSLGESAQCCSGI